MVFKRKSASEWKDSERVRLCLYDTVDALRSMNAIAALRGPSDAPLEINADLLREARAQMAALDASFGAAFVPAALPVLPADCWAIVMDFALERRTMASFGVGGVVNAPWIWRPVQNERRTKMLRAMRLVSRAWNRVASDRVTYLYAYRVPKLRERVETDFRNVRYLEIGRFVREPDIHDTKCNCTACATLCLEKRASIHAGGDRADGRGRIYTGNCCVRIDAQDRLCWLSTSPFDFLNALTFADVICYMGIEMSHLGPEHNVPEDIVVRARCIYITVEKWQPIMRMLSKLADSARARLHIYVPNTKYGDMRLILTALAPAHIYASAKTGPSTQAKLRDEFPGVTFVPPIQFNHGAGVAGPP